MYHVTGTMNLQQYALMRKLVNGRRITASYFALIGLYLFIGSGMVLFRKSYVVGGVCLVFALAVIVLMATRRRRHLGQFQKLLNHHGTDAITVDITFGETGLECANLTTERSSRAEYSQITRILQSDEFLYIGAGTNWVPVPFSGMTTEELAGVRALLKEKAVRAKWK